jgi:hypothetical protein
MQKDPVSCEKRGLAGQSIFPSRVIPDGAFNGFYYVCHTLIIIFGWNPEPNRPLNFPWIISPLLSKKGLEPGGDIPTGEQGTPWWRWNGMIGKRTLGLIGTVLMLLVMTTPLTAAEKTFRFDIPGCATWGTKERISSILQRMGGIIRFGIPADNRVDITFDDQKTDEQRIAQALVDGGVVVRTNPVSVP